MAIWWEQKNIDIVLNAKDYASKALRSVSWSIWWIKTSLQSLKPELENVWQAATVAFWWISLLMKSSIDAQNEFRNSMIWLKSIVEWTWWDFSKAEKFISEFTSDWLIPASDAATSLKNLLARWFSLDEASQMMWRFKDAAAFWRQSSLSLWDAVRSATEGIKNENSVLVDNAWVTKNVSVMWEEYAETLWISADELTIQQKREAELQWIMKETQFQVWDAKKLSEEFSWSLSRLSATFLQVKQTLWAALMPALNDLMKAITPILLSVKEWIEKNPELAAKITFVALWISWLIAWLFALSFIITPIISLFTIATTVFSWFWVLLPIVTTWVKWLSIALTFLATNPIWLLITAIWALIWVIAMWIIHWDELSETISLTAIVIQRKMKDALESLKKDIETNSPWIISAWANAWKNIKDIVFINLTLIKRSFLQKISEAKDWWKNLIQMLSEWLKEKTQEIKASVEQIATTISDYLWFHSPTKKWPWSDAHLWMPNLINMMASWLRDWDEVIRWLAVKISTTLWEWLKKNLWIEWVISSLNSIKSVLWITFNDLNSSIYSSKNRIRSLKDEVSSLRKQFSDLWNSMSTTEQEWRKAIANRAAMLEEEIIKLASEWWSKEDIILKEQELLLAKQFINNDELIQARKDIARSETQIMIDNLREKMQVIQDERSAVQSKLKEKINELKTEEDLYKELNDKRITFENAYFNIFQENISQIKISIKSAISLMDTLIKKSSSVWSSWSWLSWQRANWDPMISWGAYLVSERWPEIVVPRWSSSVVPLWSWAWITVNVNMWWVTVNNEADEQRFTKKIVDELTRIIQLEKQSISY